MNINTMPSDVKWFSSENLGMPQMMGGSNSDMLNILDACLVDGINSKVASSTSSDSGLTTISFSSAHGFQKSQMVSITGSANPLLSNNIYKIISRDMSSITIMSNAVIEQADILTVKLAPLGWESIFGTSNGTQRAYRSKTNKNRRVLFLDMSTPSPSPYDASDAAKAKLAVASVCVDMQVIGAQIEPMTDNINTSHGSSLFWVAKKADFDGASVPNTRSQWKLIGNSDFFFFIVGWSGLGNQSGTFASDTYGFGEYGDITGGQIDNTFLMAAKKASYPATISATYDANSLQKYIFIADSTLKFVGANISTISTGVHKSGATGADFPNSYGDSIFTLPLKIYRGSDIVGYLPSLLFIETKLGAIYNGDVIDDVLLLAQVLTSVSSAPTAANTGTLGFYVGG